MAVGFTPKHRANYALHGLTPQQFIGLACQAADQLGIKAAYLSDAGLIAYTDNGLFSWNGELRAVIEDNRVLIQSSSTGNDMIDLGKNKKLVEAFIQKLDEERASTAMEEFDKIYEGLAHLIADPETDILKQAPPTTGEKLREVLGIFIPSEGYTITPILINLNLLLFIAMVATGVHIVEPDGESLLKWGANFRPLTLDGQGWRLLSSCFLHIGIFHLLMNMYALLYIGILLEPLLGRSRYLAAYLLTGIAGSAASLWWHDMTISAGASGAIFGMYGVFLALLTTDLIEKESRQALLTSIGIFVCYNLINGLQGGIDNAAHIGGLLSGLLIGYAYLPSLKDPEDKTIKYGSVGVLTALILLGAFAVYQRTPNFAGNYDKKMQEFYAMESMALEVYNMSTDTPADVVMRELKDRGLYYWNENLKILDETDRMNLPEDLKKRNKLLRKYCQLRIKSYELLYQAVAENTNRYQPRIDEYNRLIDALVQEITAGMQAPQPEGSNP